MARDRNKRLIIAIALIAVVSVTIGFAAVSSSLLIKTSLSVDPTSENFSVVFSTSATKAVEGTVEPTVVPDTLEADDATITNDGTFPTINGINVVFTKPGQSVTYSFYALNNGKYDAYLTSIVLQSLTSGSFKECIAGEGATTESVNNACNSIEVRVSVGDLEVNQTTTGISTDSSKHILKIGASEAVTITIEYKEEGSIADGPVEVNFGGIYLTYGTQMTDEEPTLPVPGDVNGDGTVDSQDAIDLSYYLFLGTAQDGSTLSLPYSGDLDSDGVISANDVNLLSSKVGLVTSSPGGLGILGDANGNGILDNFADGEYEYYNDSKTIMKYVGKLLSETDFVINNADVNGDGNLTLQDAVALLQKVEGL